MSHTEPRRSSVRSLLKDKRLYIALIAGFIAIFLLAAYVGFGVIWEELRHVNPLILIEIFALSVVGSLIAAARLRTLLRVHGHKVPYPDVYNIHVTGVLGNEMTPGVHLGGEVLRILLLGRHGVRPPSAVTCALMVKILDFLILFPLALLLALLVVTGFLNTLTLLIVVIFVFFLCLAGTALLVGRGHIYRGIRRILLHIKIKEAPVKLRLSGRMGVGLVSMSFARWLIFGLQEYTVIKALGISLGFQSVFTIFSVGMIVRMAAPLPFGLGITEAVTAGLYTSFGAALSEATAAALLARTYVTLMIVILGTYGALRIGFEVLRSAIGGEHESIFSKTKIKGGK